MVFGWFSRKKEIEQIEEDTKKGFEAVKKDISSVHGWIKHLDSEKSIQEREIAEIKEAIASMQTELEGIKNVIALNNQKKIKQAFKTPQQLFNKQPAVQAVQKSVQTGVQTPKMSDFSLSERAIIWVLLTDERRLSYDDLAAILGKERSTIRGQINAIKQKSESLIEEAVEKNGKKRVFIPQEIKEKLLKKPKVRAKIEEIEEEKEEKE